MKIKNMATLVLAGAVIGTIVTYTTIRTSSPIVRSKLLHAGLQPSKSSAALGGIPDLTTGLGGLAGCQKIMEDAMAVGANAAGVQDRINAGWLSLDALDTEIAVLEDLQIQYVELGCED